MCENLIKSIKNHQKFIKIGKKLLKVLNFQKSMRKFIKIVKKIWKKFQNWIKLNKNCKKSSKVPKIY